MKKIIPASLLILALFSSPAFCQETMQRGLFVTVIQDTPVLSSRKEIVKLVDFAKKARIHTLFVQIYRENKAWFPSRVGDSAPYRECLKNVSEDPFALLIKEAHASGIEVCAWLNLLSLSANTEAPLLKKYGTSILTKDLEDKQTLEDYKIDRQFFLEPGDLRVREELTSMVGEIVRTYPDLDGIQFDYIRYPDKNPHCGFTKMNVRRFKEATDLKVVEERGQRWKDWKRDQVTALVDQLRKKARSIHPTIHISTTGLTPYERAVVDASQDWRVWLKSGRIDFVTLMCYSPSTEQFKSYLKDAKKQFGDLKKVNVAVGAYQLLDFPKNFMKRVELCKRWGSRACVIFHYGSLVDYPELAEPLLFKPLKTK